MKKTILFFLGLCLAIMVQAQVSKSVVCTAGGLSTLLTQQDYFTVTNLTISGVMDARDFKTIKMYMAQTLKVLDISAVTIVGYSGTEGTYGSNLTYLANTIPQYCFSNGNSINLASITFPTSITAIGASAFSSCEKLTTISLPSLVTSIGEYAFGSCYGLQSVTMPSTISTIGDGAFGYCKNISSISLPASVSTISTGLFQGCTKLSSFIIPSTITSIGDFAFASCSGLQTISIPETVTQIGYSAFSDCSSLQSITIPSKVTKLNSYLFKNCSTLTSIVVPVAINSIDEEVFNGCTASISLPATTIDWHYSAFRGCAGPITVNANSTIFSSSNGVLFQKLQGMLIRYPSSLQGPYTIPSTTYSINSYAFEGCTGLTSLIIPSSVSEIDSYTAGSVFANCTGLTSLITFASTPVIARFSTNNFDNIDKSKCTLFVPEGSKSAYQTASEWKIFNNIEEFGTSKTVVNTAGGLSSKINAGVRSLLTNLTVTGTIDARDFTTIRDSLPNVTVVDLSGATIVAYTGTLGTRGSGFYSYADNVVPASAFYVKTKITSITIPATTIAVDDMAFYNCTKLSAINVANVVSYIGRLAFYGCSGATSISITAPLQSIGELAFYNCNAAVSAITIPSTVTSIGDNAFMLCSKLTSVIIPGSITSMGKNVFQNCSGLQSAIILSPATTTGESIFLSCSGLTSISLPNSLTSIGASSFSSCSNITAIAIPTLVTSIGASAFDGCSKLTSVTIPSSVTTLGASIFSSCSALANAILSSSITTIPDYLFWSCSKLQSITIPCSVTAIGASAFSGCSTLTSLSIPSSVKSIGDNAFYYCNGLNAIYSYSFSPVDLTSIQSVFYNVNKTTCVLYVPTGTKSLYQAAAQWQDFLTITDNLSSFDLTSSSVNIAASQGSSTSVAILANVTWTATSNQSWLNVSPTSSTNNGNITFTATQNNGNGRTAIVTVSSSGLGNQKITVTQYGAVLLSSTSVTLAADEGSNSTVAITALVDWTATSDKSWLTVGPSTGSSNGIITFTATKNNGSVRTATVTMKAQGMSDQSITVTQATNLSPLILSNTRDNTAPVIDHATTQIVTNKTYQYFRFMPTESATYTFASTSSTEPVAQLLTSDGSYLASGMDNIGKNFKFSYNLVAGNIYFFKINNWSGDNNTISLNITGGGLQGFVYTSTGDWVSTLNWNWATLPTAFNNVAINGAVTVDQDIAISDFTVLPKSSVSINSGKKLSCSDFYLQSDSTGTASFISDVFGLKAIAEQYLKSGRNWYIASPITSAQSGVIKSTTANKLWTNNESTQTWIEIVDTTTPMSVMKGYVANVANNGVISFTGNLNTGTQSISNLSRTGTSNAGRGFNLVGNPYPSCVNWELATKSNLEPTMWYRTKNTNSAYVFDTYNADSHIGTNNNGNGSVTKFIPPMQAVWVRVNADNVSGQLSFDNSMRSHPNANNLKADYEISNIRLTVSNGKNSDETILVFNEQAGNGFDSFDSEKMFNTNNDMPELFTLADNEKLVINGMKPIDSSKVIPLGFKTAKAGTFLISITEMSGLTYFPVVLEDKLLKRTQDLTETATYSFNSDSVNDADRFIIHLKSNNETTASNIEQSGISIYAKGYSAVINNSQNNVTGTVNVFNLIGQKVANGSLTGIQTIVTLPNVAGAYFVKVKTDKVVTTQKIIVE